jgi:hypothetical protein
LSGVAVKVTEVPSSTGFAEETIETLTASNGFTVIVIVFDVEDGFDQHPPGVTQQTQ